MNWPKDIEVTINYGDEKEPVETNAKLLRNVETYGEFGPMAEYESAGGMRFWIEAEYMQVCQDTKKLPDIPIEVIRKNESWYTRKEEAERLLGRQALEQRTGLILPPSFEVPKV